MTSDELPTDGLRVCTGPDGGHHIVRCPSCSAPRVLYIKTMWPEEARVWRENNPLVDMTAAIAKPEDRQRLMQQAAGMDGKGMAMPWVSCVSCGYDNYYTIGAP